MKSFTSSNPWALIRLGFLSSILCASLFLLAYRSDLEENIAALQLGKADIMIDIRVLSDEWSEKDLRQKIPNLSLACKASASPDLEDQICEAYIRSFLGVKASYVLFGFRNNKLARMAVDIPWLQHSTMEKQLIREFGYPDSKDAIRFMHGNFVRWKLGKNSLYYNWLRDLNPLGWSTIIWVSSKEEASHHKTK